MMSKGLENRVHALPATVSFPGFGMIVDLDKPVAINSRTYTEKSLSLRDYLLILKDSNSTKAQEVLTILEAPALWMYEQLRTALSVSRLLPTSNTVGAQILAGSSSPIPVESATTVASAVGTTMDSAVEAGTATLEPAAHGPMVPRVALPQDAILQAVETLPGIAPSEYRQAVYMGVDLSSDEVSLTKPSDITADVPTAKIISGKRYHLTDYPFDVSSSEWQAIQTLSPKDAIQLRNPELFELGYSARANQYYVRIKPDAPAESQLNYYLYTQPDMRSEFRPYEGGLDAHRMRLLQEFQFNDSAKLADLQREFLYLPEDDKLNLLVRFVRNFKDKPLSRHFEHFTLEALNTILRERAGVCEQRAIIFMALAQLLEIDARMVTNNSHAYCEVVSASGWVERVDLGGGIRAQAITKAANPAADIKELTLRCEYGRILEVNFIQEAGKFENITLSLPKDYDVKRDEMLAKRAEIEVILSRFGAERVGDSDSAIVYGVADIGKAAAIAKACHEFALSNIPANFYYDAPSNGAVVQQLEACTKVSRAAIAFGMAALGGGAAGAVANAGAGRDDTATPSR